MRRTAGADRVAGRLLYRLLQDVDGPLPESRFFFNDRYKMGKQGAMTGKIAFDYDQALGRATALFWRKGYVGTGLRDLLKEMGIGEGSFYNTLKSKKQLFLLCLDRYDEMVTAGRMEAMARAPSAGAGVRAFFAHMFDCLDDPAVPSRLCMIAATVTEDVLDDADLRQRATQGIKDLEAHFAACLARDVQPDPAAGPDVLAAILTAYVQGLWRMALVDYDRRRFETQTEALLAGLGL